MRWASMSGSWLGRHETPVASVIRFVMPSARAMKRSGHGMFSHCAVAASDAPSPGGSALMRIPPRKIPGAPTWGMALLEAGLAGGFDFAYSYEIESWDELSVPLHFLDPDGDIPVATVYTNCAAPPLPTLRRCHEMGAFVGRFARSHPGVARVAFVATGGISHWVGTPETRRINPEWDHWVIDHIERGDVEPLLRLTWDEIERDGGNGGQEIRNWVALMGAVPGWKGESLAYEPVPEWITGCGTVWVHA